MILLTVLIILFIILLLYKCRLFTEEKYTIGSLGIDWKNKAGVSGSVNKWIMVLYDDETGNKIHETEDDSPQNLQNFMDVNLKAIEDKKFGSEILGTNTLSVYYNSISDDTKVYSGEFSLGTNDFSASVSDISAKESNVPTWSELTIKKDTLEEILGTEGTKIYVYPKDSTEDLYKFINRNACDINDPKWWVRKTCFIQELGFVEITGENGYFYPNFPMLGHSYKYFGVNSTNQIVMVNETSRKKFYLEKPEGVTDTNTVKYGQFAYDNTNGDKYYMYVSGDDELKVAKLSDINNKSSTIFEFRYSKDCESYWENVNKDKVNGNWKFGSEVYDCGPGDSIIHNCQRWEHVRVDAVGGGESCPSDMKVNGHVITTEWPKETTISELNKNVPTYLETTYANIIAENTDPNKNETLVNTPHYYKNEYDTINASINANKAQEKEITTVGFKWFVYDKHLKTKSAFSEQTPSRSGEGITDLSWKNIIKELGISGTPGDQGETARQSITGDVAGDYGSNYSIHFTGTYVPKTSGEHEFQTTSDDMSFLYIDDELIVDNGGLHWFVEKQGKKTLTEGQAYKIDIYFSEKGGDDGVDVEIKYPGDGNWSHIFDFTPLKNVRYVWFGYENSSWSGRPLNIREIEVYSGNVNIVEGLSGDNVKSETGFYRDGASFPPQQLFDQNTSAAYNFGHTENGETNYFKIDLGKEYSVIDKVMVYNRTDCCQDRWASSFVKLLDDNGNEIVRSNETLPDDKTEAKNYKEGNVRVKTFTFPGATTPTNQDCDLAGAKKEIELKTEQGYQFGPQIGTQACNNNNCPADCWAGI